jgi:uncharacterized protein
MTTFSPETYLGLLALGFATGVYGTLLGAGGGFVLMPLLILLYPHEKPELLTDLALSARETGVAYLYISGDGIL